MSVHAVHHSSWRWRWSRTQTHILGRKGQADQTWRPCCHASTYLSKTGGGYATHWLSFTFYLAVQARIVRFHRYSRDQNVWVISASLLSKHGVLDYGGVLYVPVCCWGLCAGRRPPSLTVVMAFRAVSAPMLRSEPGTLLETVAGTMTMGTQNSSYFPRAVNNSSSDRKACRAEPRALVVVGIRTVTGCCGLGGATCHKGRRGKTKKWKVPRGRARSITTDNSETDRYLSWHTLTHTHTHICTYTINSFAFIRQRKIKAGELLIGRVWNG